MADRRPAASVVHRMPKRTRLRVRLEEDEEALFERIAKSLAKVPAVRTVRANARTGSLLIDYEGEFEPILAQARQWLDLEPARPRAPMRVIRRTIERIDLLSAEESAHLSSLAFVALVGASLYQASRGHFLPAGLTVVGYALSVMNWAADREPPLET